MLTSHCYFLCESGLTCSTVVFFFFSSRRRHTRLTCDWSSDVCSSDLIRCRALGNVSSHHVSISQIVAEGAAARILAALLAHPEDANVVECCCHALGNIMHDTPLIDEKFRSEERRVGKEGRCRWAADQ